MGFQLKSVDLGQSKTLEATSSSMTLYTYTTRPTSMTTLLTTISKWSVSSYPLVAPPQSFCVAVAHQKILGIQLAFPVLSLPVIPLLGKKDCAWKVSFLRHFGMDYIS